MLASERTECAKQIVSVMRGLPRDNPPSALPEEISGYGQVLRSYSGVVFCTPIVGRAGRVIRSQSVPSVATWEGAPWTVSS
jgi:hypothetical protein